MGADSVLSQKIKQYRKIRSMTQEELAEEIGVTTDHIASIESGRRKVSVENLIRFCESFHIDTSELLPIGKQDDDTLKQSWINDINETLGLLSMSQLGLVRAMICALNDKSHH